jgi:hypothetical protein
MATRKNLSHPEKVRRRIQTSQIVNRLTEHVLGEAKMSATQVTAALGLLRKTVPDLSAMEHSGSVTRRDITDKPLTDEEWSEQYATH